MRRDSNDKPMNLCQMAAMRRVSKPTAKNVYRTKLAGSPPVVDWHRSKSSTFPVPAREAFKKISKNFT